MWHNIKYLCKCKWLFCCVAWSMCRNASEDSVAWHQSNYCMCAIASDHSVAEHEVCGQGQVHVIDTPDLTRKPKFRNNHPKSINLSIYLPTDLSWSIYRICIYIIYTYNIYYYVSICLSICLYHSISIYLSSLYLPTYLPTYLAS